MNRNRILLADEHVLLTDALANNLAKDFDVIGTAHDGRELIRKTLTDRPDVVITDVHMPVLSGIQAAQTIHKEAPRSKLLFLTKCDEMFLIQEAFQSGALGYVLKSCRISEFIRAVQSVARGFRYVSPEINVHFLQFQVHAGSRCQQGRDALTQRQRQILQMIAEGKTMKEIGVSLGISARTAEAHKYIMMRVVGVSTTASLIRYAVRTNAVEN